MKSVKLFLYFIIISTLHFSTDVQCTLSIESCFANSQFINRLYDEDEDILYSDIQERMSRIFLEKQLLDSISPIKIQAIINCYQDSWHNPSNEYTVKNINIMRRYLKIEMKKRQAAINDIIRLKKAINSKNQSVVNYFIGNSLYYDGYSMKEKVQVLKNCLNLMNLKDIDLYVNGINYNVQTGNDKWAIYFENTHLFIEIYSEDPLDCEESSEGYMRWDFIYDEKGIELVDFIFAG